MSYIYIYGKPISMERLGRSIAWRKVNNEKNKSDISKLTYIGERVECPICSCQDKKEFVTIHGATYLECSNCGHLYQKKIVDPEIIKKIYENESEYLAHVCDVYSSRVEMIATPKVEFITQAVQKGKNDLEWFDIGCGACEILSAAKKFGWKVKGVETSDLGLKFGQKLGIPVIQEYLTEDNAPELVKDAHLISIFNVLEHLERPKHTLKNILNAAQNCEYLAVEVPHHPSLSAFCSQLFPDNVARHLIIPEHIHIYTEKSITLLIEECGFKITHCWKFGQDFYELLSTVVELSGHEISILPKQLLEANNEIQAILDKFDFSDAILLVAKRKKD